MQNKNGTHQRIVALQEVLQGQQLYEVESQI